MAQQIAFKSPPVSELGALLHVRRFSMTGHSIGAAFIFLAPTALGVITVLTGKPQDAATNAFAIGITTLFGAIGGGMLWFLGWRRSGQTVEAYEGGMRILGRSGQG